MNERNHLYSSLSGRSLAPWLQLKEEMDRLFEEAWQTPKTSQVTGRGALAPVCELDEEDDHYSLSLDMPGIPKDKIKIEVVDQQLIVKGERLEETKRKDKGLHYSERSYGKYMRSFALPSGLDVDKIEAQFHDGVLRLLIPKPVSAKAREIKIGTPNESGFFGRLIGQNQSEKISERSVS